MALLVPFSGHPGAQTAMPPRRRRHDGRRFCVRSGSGTAGRLRSEGACRPGRAPPPARPDLSLVGEHQVIGDDLAQQLGADAPLADAGGPPEEAGSPQRGEDALEAHLAAPLRR